MEIVDPNQLHLSRKRLIKEIATTFKVQLIALYKELDIENNQFSLQPLAANKRSLKNLCLYYLMELGDSNIYCSCVEQFKTSHNMTDRIAALTYIVNNELAEKEWALNDFIDTWGYQDSVVDKWFAVQAASSVSSTLNTVEDLVSHQLFDYTNPNKVYSLLRTFGSNHLRFHDESGKAYHFLANQIIKLDSINPQVAARLSRSFDRCERFDDVRWSHAQNALSKINRTIDLSKDTREIVSKILPN